MSPNSLMAPQLWLFSESQFGCACNTLLTAMATMLSEHTTDIQLGCIPYCLNLSQGNALMYSRQIHDECTELDQACKSVKDYVRQHLFCI